MRTLELEATIGADSRLTVTLPPDIPPGRHRVVLVIDEQVTPERPRELPPFPVIHIESWSDDLSLRREDMYGDEGR